MSTLQYPPNQDANRDRLYAAHQKLIDVYWDDDGRFIGSGRHGDLRIAIWHAMALLGGDAHCVQKANRIIFTHYSTMPCHFSVGASIKVLKAHGPRLTDEVRETLERYLRLNLPYMCTEDLKIRGGNDNHPFKAMYDLVVGGELMDQPHYVERGVFRLRRAVEWLASSGFPGEYNSPTYSAVSLQPLASIVESARNEEARELALRLEHFYWRDVALHFDPRAGIPTGPMSRSYSNDTEGLFSNVLCLLMHLYPERFAVDWIDELYVRREQTAFVPPFTKTEFGFYLSHPIIMASTAYHLTPELERAMFERPAGTYVRGMAENASSAIRLEAADPAKVPRGAPGHHFIGGRRGLLSAYYGENYSLGTSQYVWNDNSQSSTFYATTKRPGATGDRSDPRHASLYYARMFFDESYPNKEVAEPVESWPYFREQGESRILQHRNTAMVFYNPFPTQRRVQRLRVGLFRPLSFSTPEELYIGEMPVPSLNIIWHETPPIAIRDGNTYIGIIPAMLHNHEQGRKAPIQIHTYSDHLAILFSGFEDWAPRDYSYNELIETNMGFVFEAHDAADFASFAEFRRWLARARVDDDYYLWMRHTTYRREGLTFASTYCPFQSNFNHAAVNGESLPMPVYQVDGIPDPGAGLLDTARKILGA